MVPPLRKLRALTRMVALPRPGLWWLYSKTLYRLPSNSNVTPLRKSFTSIIKTNLIVKKILNHPIIAQASRHDKAANEKPGEDFPTWFLVIHLSIVIDDGFTTNSMPIFILI